MIRFVFLLIVIITVIICLLNIWVLKSVWYRNFTHIFEKFKNVPFNLEIANIGSGPSLFDFDWENETVNGFNLAVWPEDFRYDLKILKRYKRNFKEDAIIIVVVCPLSFGENKYLNTPQFLERYINVLPYREIELPYIWYILYKYFPSIRFLRHWKKILKEKKLETYYQELDNIDNEKKRTELAQELYYGWLKSNPLLSDLEDGMQSDRMSDIIQNRQNDLQELIDFCINSMLRPVIVIPPVGQYLKRRISQEFAENFVYIPLKKFKERNIPIFDYYNDDKYEQMDLYSNGLFLQKEARKNFTKQFLKDIKRMENI